MNAKTTHKRRSFLIWEILAEAWEATSSAWGPLWAIIIVMCIAVIIVLLLISLIFKVPVDIQEQAILYRSLIMPIILAIVAGPFYGGAIMVAIKRARNEPVRGKTGFQYFHKTWQTMLTLGIIEFLANITIYIIRTASADMTTPHPYMAWWYLLAAVVTIFVYVFSILAIPFVVDKNFSPLHALYRSYKTIRPCWFRTLVLLIALYLFYVIASIPLIIGAMIHPIAQIFGFIVLAVALIWLVPYTYLVLGYLYHKLVD